MSFLPHFSHIYIENEDRDYPLTRSLLERFSRAITIPINDYKEVFNRPRQRWDHQSRSLKLILAKRKDAFIYPGSSFVPNFKHTHSFYTTPVLNCIYGCEYCYLKGMFSSPNLVAFVNESDFIQAASDSLSNDAPAYLCISYDTDLLALENIFGYCARYIEYARANPHVTVEIRTKSANISALDSIAPTPNVILAWTVSPECVISRYEHRTPPLKSRLLAISKAYQRGWRVRLCIDPILRINSWQEHYQGLVQTIFKDLAANEIDDVSIGVFRISSGYLRTMQERDLSSPIVQYPYTVSNQSASYTPEQHREMLQLVSEQLSLFVPQEKICPVPWQL